MADKVIVCNAGPLIALTLVQSLPLLGKLYGDVLVPRAVYQEVVESGQGRPGAEELQSATWAQVVTLQTPPEPLLTHELGRGEAEVIALASKLGADRALLDERRARRIAEQVYDLRVRGSAGILVAAKKAGWLSEVRPLLETMRREGYFISDRLLRSACTAAGET